MYSSTVAIITRIRLIRRYKRSESLPGIGRVEKKKKGLHAFIPLNESRRICYSRLILNTAYLFTSRFIE